MKTRAARVVSAECAPIPGASGVGAWIPPARGAVTGAPSPVRLPAAAAVLGGAAADVEEETETETVTRLAPPWNVIVHDDPVTLQSYVTRVFIKVFAYSETKARRLMLEVHTSGRSVVWTGGREEAETYVSKLQGHHLLASLELTDE